MTYYCGPKSWPKFIKKRLSRYHNESCRLHDDEYKTRMAPRKEIDALFLTRMLVKADNEATPRNRKKARKHAKRLYFWVRKFGWIFWLIKKGGQKTGYKK